MRDDIVIRPETPKDYKNIVSLVLRSFREGTNYSDGSDIVMLAPVSVHADYFYKHIGVTMLTLGIQKVREMGYKGVTVEGDYNFYNRVGFKTSSEL